MAIQLRAANSVTSVSNAASVAVTLPAGSAAGDILFIVLRVGTNGLTVTQTAGTPTWTIQFQGNDATTHYTYAFASVVLTSGFTAPTFSWTTSSTWQYTVIGFSSSISAALSVDAWASLVNTSALSNTVTPNAVTAAGSGEASVILTEARGNIASVTTDTATFTPPASWTTPAGGTAFGSASGAFDRFTGACYQLGVSGTVTPGTESLTDNGGHTYTFVVAHVLVQEAAAAAPSGTVQPRATVPVPRRAPARAAWARIAGQQAAQVPAPRQLPGTLPRRPPARAYIRFTPVITVNAAAVTPVSGTVQPLAARPASRRIPARAYIQFRPVTTVNAAPAGAGRPVLAIDTESRLIRRYRHMLHRHGFDSLEAEVSMLSAPVAVQVPPGWPGTWPAELTAPEPEPEPEFVQSPSALAPKWRPVYTRPPKVVRARHVPRDAMMPVWRKTG